MPQYFAITLCLWLLGVVLSAFAGALVMNGSPQQRLERLPTAAFAVGAAVFFAFGGGFLTLTERYNFVEFTYTDEALAAGTMHVLLLFAAFLASAFVIVRRAPDAPARPIALGRINDLALLLFTVLPLLGVLVVLQRAIGMGFIAYFADRINATAGLGYAVALSRLSLVSVVVLFAVASGTRLPLAVLRAVAIVTAITGLVLMGSRADFVLLALATLLTRRLLRPDRPLVDLRALGFAAALGAIVVALGAVRQFVLLNDETVSFVEFVRDDLALQVRTAVSESEVPIWLASRPANWDAAHGVTYAAAAVGLVPRALWSGKPVGAGPRLKNAIRPESYALGGGRQISSYTPGVVGESVMNFGAFGPPVVGAIAALLLALLGRVLARLSAPMGPALIAIASLVAALAVKAEFFGLFARLFSMLVLPLLLVLIARAATTLLNRPFARLART